MNLLGIDIGRTSIKYGRVRLENGIEVMDFDQIPISQTSRYAGYRDALIHLLRTVPGFRAVGVGFPCVIRQNRVYSRDVDFDGIWSEVQAFLEPSGAPCFALNDADAAGMAEITRPEAGDLRRGATIVLTLGTGIGSAIFLDGKLLPNTELGRIELHGGLAEQYCAASVRTREGLSFEAWAGRLQEYLAEVDELFAPDHLVLGGGISADFEQYRAGLKTHADLRPAHYCNQAGVIGAAMFAAGRLQDGVG
ncbi:transcriptional regulator/sugar kinase [Longilinea arvoryzae]|uniref:Transcriptional regulator/sugar kinase n=1 Tax=Longilinea arvoryzae TaxID=360412 RepID=A0A0S7BEW6_9CHLR|nr:ROK family protein [Longilinea arvoryzae]GAP13075.1 transcriptional regulator/sugar kinase [Longilinea arvoryzae]